MLFNCKIYHDYIKQKRIFLREACASNGFPDLIVMKQEM